MKAPDIIAALEPVVEVFESLGVGYHVGGSVVSSAYGVPRATLDVDVVANLRLPHVKPLVEHLQELYFIEEGAVLDAVLVQATFNVIHLATMMKVDVFVLSQRPFERQAFQRRQQDTLEEGEGARLFYLATPEDIVLHKLRWFRLGGEVSERQRRDALGVIQVQSEGLDRSYLRRWAHVLKVSDLLERVLSEAGID